MSEFINKAPFRKNGVSPDKDFSPVRFEESVVEDATTDLQDPKGLSALEPATSSDGEGSADSQTEGGTLVATESVAAPSLSQGEVKAPRPPAPPRAAKATTSPKV